MRRFLACLLAAAAAALAWWGLGPRSPAAVRPREAEAPGRPLPGYVPTGAGSCAAAACHGGDGPPWVKGNEYTAWMNCDPHRRAYHVLFDERSTRIIKNLHDSRAAPVNPLCLACHATPPGSSRSPCPTLADGVSCEACHGPAGRWLALHYRPQWQALSPAEKVRLGMWPTKDMAARARVCVGCHVGAAGRDVNHDLLAAGHPRLHFEYSSYLAILPKHWNVWEEKARLPDLEARAWQVGQVVSGRAALDLLAHRAGTKNNPWPEFAEYNCFACHQDLREPGARRGPVRGRLGALPWDTWYFSDVFRRELATRADPDARELARGLADLRREMEKPLPDRQLVREQARQLAGRLNPWLHDLEGAPCQAAAALRERIRTLTGNGQKAAGVDWDQATQRYLAAAAFYQAMTDLNPADQDPGLKAVIQGMRQQLVFPKGYDSPRRGEPGLGK